MAYFLVPDGAAGGVSVGFLSPWYSNAISDGVSIGNAGGGNFNTIAATHRGVSTVLYGQVIPDQTYGFAVQLTVSGYDIWAQGGLFEQWGFKLHTADWLKIYSYTAGPISGTLYSAIDTRVTGVDLPINEVDLTDDFEPSTAHGMMVDLDQTLVDTHVGSAVYDNAGNLWVGWMKGTSDTGHDVLAFAKVRLPDGTWSSNFQLADSNGNVIPGSLSIVQGQVWCVLNTTSDAWNTVSVIHRNLSVDAGAKISATDPAPLLTSSASVSMNFSSIFLSGSTYILPLSDTSGHWWTASTTTPQDPASWVEGAKSSGSEPSVVTDPDGTLVAIVRTSASLSTYRPRFTSTDNGNTWTAAGTIPVRGNNSRGVAVRLWPYGTYLYCTNDNGTDWGRNLTTAWEISGTDAVAKIPLNNQLGWFQNYPCIAIQGNQTTLVNPIRSNPGGVGVVLVAERPLRDWGEQ